MEVAQDTRDFFHNLRQELMADAESNGDFLIARFVETITKELIDAGFMEDCNYDNYKVRGLQYDGYWFDDDKTLSVIIADFDVEQTELQSLTKTEVSATFKRSLNFIESSIKKDLHNSLEETTPAYSFARLLNEEYNTINKINIYLVSDKVLSERLKTLKDDVVMNIPISFHVWDLSRIQRQRNSKENKEALDIHFVDTFETGLPCLPADHSLDSEISKSYLIVIPGTILSSLYEQHGARLLEQNVRCFLQTRGNVNKGIRNTIINEPQMFYAYNNGITATAAEVETRLFNNQLEITRIKDLQIVNGGQTTASLSHTHRNDKAALDNVFIQMKLSVVDKQKSELIIPKISQYANTQNRVNAADFFSNHPFHIRMEELSRKLWAPTHSGKQRETKWFYERARGQYADAQSKLTPSQKNKFLAENPKPQMFTKTDLAKFENVWDEEPTYVNLGAQKNFAQYAKRIGQLWDKSSTDFNEYYFKKVIARAILFRSTEKLVSAQSWYNGGYRANIVAYSLALLGHIADLQGKHIDFMRIWDQQAVSTDIESALEIIAKLVHDDITNPMEGITNVTEWCKKKYCWQRLMEKSSELEKIFSDEFLSCLIDKDSVNYEIKSAKGLQKIDDGIYAQKEVLGIPVASWQPLMKQLESKGLLSSKEKGILSVASKIPAKIPSEKQCIIILSVLAKAKEEGIEI